MADFEIVAAVAENRVIGADDRLPWHHPEDLERFRERTEGHPLVMGRVTHESIVERNGGPLDGRHHVVLSGSVSYEESTSNVTYCSEVDYAVGVANGAAARMGVDVAYVVGGASVYKELLPRCSRMHITEVSGEPEGDARFPAVDWGAWEEASREDSGGLSFVTYERADL